MGLRIACDTLSRISPNVEIVDTKLADIHGAFRGREGDYLCLEIEPTLEGATAIANLFWEALQEFDQCNGMEESTPPRGRREGRKGIRLWK